jgi:hypothetical protein
MLLPPVVNTGLADSQAAGAAGAVQLAVIKSTNQSRASVALVAAMGFAALYFLIYPLWRSQFLFEIWFTEGWNAYFQDAAAIGENIYPPAGNLLVNNYPPLSFYAIGLLGKAIGADNLFVGRAVSLIALVTVAFEIFA